MDVGGVRWCLPNSWKFGTGRGTPGLGSGPRLSWGVAKEESGRRSLPLRRPRGSFLFGLIGVEPAFQEGDGRGKVLVEGEQQVNVVKVFLQQKQWARLLRGLTVARISPQPGQRKRK